jgi:hypothetical protein
VAQADLSERTIPFGLRIHGRTVRRARAKLREAANEKQGRLFFLTKVGILVRLKRRYTRK